MKDSCGKRRISFCPPLLLLCALLALPAHAAAKTAGEIYKENRAAIVHLRIEGYDHSGGRWEEAKWTCSGFVIEGSGMIATNGHCVEGATGGFAVFSDGSLLRITGVRAFEYGDSRFFDGQSGFDAAVVQVSGFDLPAVTLGNSNDVGVGDEITVIGFPMQSEFESLGERVPTPTVTQGIISSERILEGLRQLGIDASISSGNSGGPVFNEDGEVIGMATWNLVRGQNLNFVFPINYLRGLDMGDLIGSIPGLFQDPRGASRPTPSSDSQPFMTTMRETGTLEPGDETLDSGEFFDTVSFEGQAGSAIVLELSSDEFVPYLILLPPSGAENRQERDAFGEDDSGLVRMETILDETGSFMVGVTSHAPEERGAWRLTVSDGRPEISPLFGGLEWLVKLHDAEATLSSPTLNFANRYPDELGGRLEEGQFPYMEIYDAATDGVPYETRLYYGEDQRLVKATMLISLTSALATEGVEIMEGCLNFYVGFFEESAKDYGSPTESLREWGGLLLGEEDDHTLFCQAAMDDVDGVRLSDWWATRHEWESEAGSRAADGPFLSQHSFYMRLITTDNHDDLRLLLLWEHDSILD